MKKIWRLILTIIFVLSVYQLVRDMFHAIPFQGIVAKMKQRWPAE